MPEPVDPQQRFMTSRERLADDVGLRLLKAADDFADGDLILGNLYALRDAVMAEVLPVLEQLDALKAATERVRAAFNGTTPGGSSKLDALLQRAADGRVSVQDARDLGRVAAEFRDRLGRILAALDHPTDTTGEGDKPDWRKRARARVGDRVAARMQELLAEPDEPETEPDPAEHTAGNAEDCPRCTGRRDLAYPFICPGTNPDTTGETETL